MFWKRDWLCCKIRHFPASADSVGKIWRSNNYLFILLLLPVHTCANDVIVLNRIWERGWDATQIVDISLWDQLASSTPYTFVVRSATCNSHKVLAKGRGCFEQGRFVGFDLYFFIPTRYFEHVQTLYNVHCTRHTKSFFHVITKPEETVLLGRALMIWRRMLNENVWVASRGDFVHPKAEIL